MIITDTARPQSTPRRLPATAPVKVCLFKVTDWRRQWFATSLCASSALDAVIQALRLLFSSPRMMRVTSGIPSKEKAFLSTRSKLTTKPSDQSLFRFAMHSTTSCGRSTMRTRICQPRFKTSSASWAAASLSQTGATLRKLAARFG